MTNQLITPEIVERREHEWDQSAKRVVLIDPVTGLPVSPGGGSSVSTQKVTASNNINGSTVVTSVQTPIASTGLPIKGIQLFDSVGVILSIQHSQNLTIDVCLTGEGMEGIIPLDLPAGTLYFKSTSNGVAGSLVFNILG
jgi:hypothetical protein